MLNYSVRLVGRYTHAQDVTYTIPACMVLLNIAGLRRFRVDGLAVADIGPMLSLFTAGMVLDFAYTAERENWVLMGDTHDIRCGDTPGTVLLRDGNDWIPVPMHVPVVATQLAPLQDEFLQLLDAFRDPLPARMLRIRVGLAALLRFFLDHSMNRSTTPASRLKRMIDDDHICRESLSTMSNRVGYHPDHLRNLFSSAYGITPIDYRNRRRLAMAMTLIATSSLGVGEIGRQIGFAHVSHFSSFFTKSAGITPRQAISQFRHH